MNLFERHARLNQLFQQTPVDAAYLSGSLAGRKAFGEMSDVDIAILLTEQIATDHFLDFQLYFLSELTKRLESDALDVVILNQASLLLRLQVIKYGQILYSRDEKKRSQFEARTVIDYLDFRQMDDLQNQALSRRLRTPMLTIDGEGMTAALRRLAAATAQIAASVALPDAAARYVGTSDADGPNTGDIPTQAVLDRALLLAIEAMTQLATLLLAGLSVPLPESYDDLLAPLVKRQVLNGELAARLLLLLQQRDALLRTPEQLDRPVVFALAQTLGPDLAQFGAAVAALLPPPAA